MPARRNGIIRVTAMGAVFEHPAAKLIAIFPALDITWTNEVQELWWRDFEKLWAAL